MSRINGFIGRRNFLGLAGLGGLAIAGSVWGSNVIQGQKQTPIDDLKSLNPDRVDAQEALKLLLAGNQRFVQGQPIYPHHSRERRQLIAKAQYPFAAVLGCADSRVPAEIVFDQGLGDLFVVRVAGNVASDMAISSLEYATSVLGTQLIVVLGHKKCGAVAATIKNEVLPGKIGDIVKEIQPALAKVKLTGDQFDEAAVIANIDYQTEKLRQKSTVISELINQDKLLLVAATYDIDTGEVVVKQSS